MHGDKIHPELSLRRSEDHICLHTVAYTRSSGMRAERMGIICEREALMT